MKKIVAVFGPAGATPGSRLYRNAEHLGNLLAEGGFATISGGYEGVMEAVSKGASGKNGTVIGVTADVYHNRGREANPYLTREIKVKSATDRLMELLDLADAYIACGISPGTLTEVATAWDYMIKKFMAPKPLILLGTEWEELCDVLFLQNPYVGKDTFVSFAHSPDSALDCLIATFGKQQNLPELSVMNTNEGSWN